MNRIPGRNAASSHWSLWGRKWSEVPWKPPNGWRISDPSSFLSPPFSLGPRNSKTRKKIIFFHANHWHWSQNNTCHTMQHQKPTESKGPRVLVMDGTCNARLWETHSTKKTQCLTEFNVVKVRLKSDVRRSRGSMKLHREEDGSCTKHGVN